MNLRPYQHDCLSAIEEDFFKRHVEKLLAVLATGLGKTVIASYVPRWFPGKRTMFLVHTEELAKQAHDKMSRCNPGLQVGIEMGDRYADCSDIVVASVQTLGREGSPRLSTFRPEDFASIMIDEAHHAAADSYERVLHYFGLAGMDSNVGRLLLGITATPGRSDGVGLARVFDKISYNYGLLDAIRDGWLCTLRGIRVRTTTNLDAVHTNDGEFDQQELSLAVNTPERNRLVVEEWTANAKGKKTLGFTVDIAHAKDMAGAFRSAGVRAEAVWGVDPDRENKLRSFRAGDIEVLLNASVLTEGYDEPTVECVLLAAPTKSQLRYIQRLGRGTRLPEGVENLLKVLGQGFKEYCLVLDFTDSTTRHSVATLPSVFGLPKDLDLKGGSIVDAVAQIENAKLQYPEVDLEGLDSLENLQSYAERVDLLTIQYAPEVLENSLMQWHRTANGDYLLLFPRNEKVSITQDLLGHWNIAGTVNGNSFEDAEKDLPTAFRTADNLIRYLGRSLMSLVRRETSSKKLKEPITKLQKHAIEQKLWHQGKTVPNLDGLTKGEASQILRKLSVR